MPPTERCPFSCTCIHMQAAAHQVTCMNLGERRTQTTKSAKERRLCSVHCITSLNAESGPVSSQPDPPCTRAALAGHGNVGTA